MSIHRVRTNAYWVLGLDPEAGRAAVERAAARLLDELAIEHQPALHVDTPLGILKRTPELVREAAERLRSGSGRTLERELAEVITATSAEVRAALRGVEGGAADAGR